MRKVVLAALLITSLLVPVSAQAATAKAGATCTKLKATQVVGTKKFTCVKSRKKLVWDKGVAIPKVIVKKTQVITAPVVTDQDLLKVSTYNFEFPKVGSDAPFVVGTKDASICSVEGFKISFLQVGTCSLTFNKGEDGLFEAAKEVTITFKIFLAAQPGEKANPAGLGIEITKAGVSVTLDAINEEVSDDVCAADTANNSCVDKNGTGVFQSTNNDHYIEIVFTIINNSDKTWIASNVGMQVDAEHNYLSTTVYTIDSLDGLEIEPGDGISGSYFVLLPDSADSATALISYGDGNKATTFYFKAR